MHQPAEPEDVDVEGIIKGIHRVSDHDHAGGPKVQLLASGVGLPWAHHAKQLLRDDWGVDAAVWSVTSWNELRKDGLEVDRHNFLHPEEEARTAFLTARLAATEGPVIATSDFDHMLQDQIRPWVPRPYYTLGADGFGFSDTRPAARRHYFIDSHSMATRALQALADAGQYDRGAVANAIGKYELFNVHAGQSGSEGGDA